MIVCVTAPETVLNFYNNKMPGITLNGPGTAPETVLNFYNNKMPGITPIKMDLISTQGEISGLSRNSAFIVQWL